MGDQIIKQPNGKYMLFRSTCDRVVLCEATSEDILEFWLKEESRELKPIISEIITELDAAKKPRRYGQFTMTFEEALAEMERLHGSDDPIVCELRKIQDEQV